MGVGSGVAVGSGVGDTSGSGDVSGVGEGVTSLSLIHISEPTRPY